MKSPGGSPMARTSLNPMFIDINGRIGRLVLYNRRGSQCIRTYVIPQNPDSPAQRCVRSSFRDAVHAWQALPGCDKSAWNRRACRMSMSGYNLFISRFIKSSLASLSDASSPVHVAFSPVSSPFPPCFLSVQGTGKVKNGASYAPPGQPDAG